MRNLLLGVTCFLSVTMSAQSNINDFIDAQVSGTKIFMEYDYQMMLDSIDAQNVLLNSVAAPAITSGATGTDLAENTGADQTVYTTVATACWPAPTYAIAGTDAALLGVNASTGVVTLTANPDYETKSSYSFNVTAIDAASNTSPATTVTFSITNVDEAIPTITSGATGTDLAENSGAGETIYTITSDANDGGTIQSYAIAGTDAALLVVNASTGVVTLTADPDYETQSSYSFTVTATDETGTSNATTVTFSITDVVESAPCNSVTFEGYTYNVVQIGTQCWFAENLRSENYNTGTAISTGLDGATWGATTDGAVTVYDEGGANAVANLSTYGRLYNWYAVNTGNLCPSGWHVPTDGEHTTLIDFLGGTSVAGEKMKSSAPAWEGTNSSGFSGLAGGTRGSSYGDFNNEGNRGRFWSASASGTSAWTLRLIGGYTGVDRSTSGLRSGLSVRCVQD
ncbi:cadherin domain-containing protein [Flavobacteriales bacterium]|nr:cadherin domain-containing protein [Flavobacteriales bacterium]